MTLRPYEKANQTRLRSLYRKLYELTEPECRMSCRCPQSCCSPEICELVIEYAERRWGVRLLSTGHPRLPLMGDWGCTAEPHLRPICTFHVCSINSLGFKPNDPAWTKKYFSLRCEIDKRELRRYQETTP